MDDMNFNGLVSMGIKLFALLTPPAVLSAFIGGTDMKNSRAKNFMAFKTSLAIFCIGAFCFLFGSQLFALFGFTLDAFRIGAGILLFLSSIELMKEDYIQ